MGALRRTEATASNVGFGCGASQCQSPHQGVDIVNGRNPGDGPARPFGNLIKK